MTYTVGGDQNGLRLRDTEVGVISGPDGPTLRDYGRYATGAKDKVRHKLAQQEEMSDFKRLVMIIQALSKLLNFPAKVRFRKQGTATQITILRARLLESTSHF